MEKSKKFSYVLASDGKNTRNPSDKEKFKKSNPDKKRNRFFDFPNDPNRSNAVIEKIVPRNFITITQIFSGKIFLTISGIAIKEIQIRTQI